MGLTKPNTAEIRVDGRTMFVPAYSIGNFDVVVTGKWIKTAGIRDESVVEGAGVQDPSLFVQALKDARSGADLFTFSQKLHDIDPRFPHYYELDNVAAVPVTTFDEWWENLPQESRKNVRRSAKRGVVVKVVPF